MSITQILFLVVFIAICCAIIRSSKVHRDRSFRAFCVARARPHLKAAKKAYQQEAALLDKARTKAGYEAAFLKNDARIARYQAEAEEKMAAVYLKGTGIDPKRLLENRVPEK